MSNLFSNASRGSFEIVPRLPRGHVNHHLQAGNLKNRLPSIMLGVGVLGLCRCFFCKPTLPTMCQLLGHRNSVWITSPSNIFFGAFVSFPCPVWWLSSFPHRTGHPPRKPPLNSQGDTICKSARSTGTSLGEISWVSNRLRFSGWWFQPLWKILVKMGIFPK